MKRASILAALILVMPQVGWADEPPIVALHEGETEDKMPEFSWATVPVWLRVRKSTAYTKDEIAQIARHPIIVFEKANGHVTYGDVESGALAAAKAVKQVNPAAKVIFYFNAVIEYGGYRANREFDENVERWALRENGEIIRFKNRYHLHDLANPEVQDWWIRTAKAVADHPDIDGVFIDALCKVNARGDDYVAKSIEAMKETVAQGKILLFSAGPGAYGREEGRAASRKTAGEMRQWMRENIAYPLGVFLLVAGKHSYFEWTCTPDALQGALQDHEYDQYHKPLGQPRGPAERSGYVYTRRYEHLDVRVNIQSKKAVLRWH